LIGRVVDDARSERGFNVHSMKEKNGREIEMLYSKVFSFFLKVLVSVLSRADVDRKTVTYLQLCGTVCQLTCVHRTFLLTFLNINWKRWRPSYWARIYGLGEFSALQVSLLFGTGSYHTECWFAELQSREWDNHHLFAQIRYNETIEDNSKTSRTTRRNNIRTYKCPKLYTTT